jgi:hypothetical protein
MPSGSSVPSDRYVLTPLGRAALEDSGTCCCEWTFDGGLVVCPHCGTVYSTKAIAAAIYSPGLRRGKQA